jgi:hypothetical protein
MGEGEEQVSEEVSLLVLPLRDGMSHREPER